TLARHGRETRGHDQVGLLAHVREEVLLQRPLGDLVGVQGAPLLLENLDGCLVERHGPFEGILAAPCPAGWQGTTLGGKSKGFPPFRLKGFTLKCLNWPVNLLNPTRVVIRIRTGNRWKSGRNLPGVSLAEEAWDALGIEVDGIDI